MGKFVLRDAVITVAGSDLSDHFSSVEIDQPAEEVEFTSFGSGYREFGQGLKDATINVEAFQDFAAGEVDAVLYPLYESGGTFSVTVKADDAATSSTNPIYRSPACSTTTPSRVRLATRARPRSRSVTPVRLALHAAPRKPRQHFIARCPSWG
jgi:hypothetical protein